MFYWTQRDANVLLLAFYITSNAMMATHDKINNYLNIYLIFYIRFKFFCDTYKNDYIFFALDTVNAGYCIL